MKGASWIRDQGKAIDPSVSVNKMDMCWILKQLGIFVTGWIPVPPVPTSYSLTRKAPHDRTPAPASTSSPTSCFPLRS